jgi:hypothetical protein
MAERCALRVSVERLGLAVAVRRRSVTLTQLYGLPRVGEPEKQKSVLPPLNCPKPILRSEKSIYAKLICVFTL